MRSGSALWTAALIIALASTSVGVYAADPAADLQRGNDLFKAGDYDTAVQVLSEVAAADPKLAPDAQRTIGTCYQLKGDYAKAIECYEKLLTTYPGSEAASEVYYWLGTCYESQKNVDQAISCFEKQISGFPTSRKTAPAMLKLGERYQDKTQYDLAMQQFEKVAKEYPERAARVQLLIGICYQVQGRYQEAIDALDKVTASSNGNGSVNEVKLRKAECLRGQGKYAEELAYLQTLCAESPDLKADSLVRQAEVLKDYLRDYPQAIAVLERVITECPDSRLAVEAQARIASVKLYGLWDIAEARKMIQDFVAKHPDYPGMIYVRCDLAYCSYAEGKYLEAAKLFEEAYTCQDSENWRPPILYIVGDSYKRAGDKAKAQEAWNKLMDVYPGNDWSALAAVDSTTLWEE